MDTPNFEGLHGNELINKHLAWQMRARKGGASFEKVRYAGLSQAQAVEMYQYLQRQVLPLGILVVIFQGGLVGVSTILSWGEMGPWHFIGNILGVVAAVLLGLSFIYRSVRVRNTDSARRAYIRSTDERLESVRRRSGVKPMMFTAYVVFAVGGAFLSETSDAMTWDITPTVAAGIALCGAGLAQFIIALATYGIMRLR